MLKKLFSNLVDLFWPFCPCTHEKLKYVYEIFFSVTHFWLVIVSIHKLLTRLLYFWVRIFFKEIVVRVQPKVVLPWFILKSVKICKTKLFGFFGTSFHCAIQSVLKLINTTECLLFMALFDFLWYPFPLERQTVFSASSNKRCKTNTDALWNLRWKH